MAALVIGTTFGRGINSDGFQGLYPVLIAISAFSQRSPRRLYVIGFFCLLWILLLYFFEVNGLYANQVAGLDLSSKSVFLAFNISFVVLLLQITIQNLVQANVRLEAAREEALAAKLQAENANRAKSAFLANMSHELRTPLNAIIGYSEGMIEEAEFDDAFHLEDIYIQDLQSIQLAGRHLLGIISDILDISKIEAEMVDIQPMLFEVDVLFYEVIDTTQPLIERNQNHLNVEITIPPGTMLATDRLKLKQIILNLLSNAAKYTQEGTIWFRAYFVDQSPAGKGYGPYLCVEVEDTGVGIPPHHLKTIFEAFKQADNSITRSFEGTGLGLAICKRFVELLEGEIDVTSTIAQGSLFTIHIPKEIKILEPIPLGE